MNNRRRLNGTCVSVTSFLGRFQRGVQYSYMWRRAIYSIRIYFHSKFKGERIKGSNDTHVIKDGKGRKEFSDLFCW